MLRKLLLTALLLLPGFLQAQSYYWTLPVVNSNVAPYTANSGVEYTVGVAVASTGAGGGSFVTLYKNGFFFIDGFYSVSRTSTDYGAQDVGYTARYNDIDGNTGTDQKAVRILAAAAAPTVSINAPGNATVGTLFSVGITVDDVNGDLHSMGIRKAGYTPNYGLVGGPWDLTGTGPDGTRTHAENATTVTPDASGYIYLRGEVWDSAGSGVAGPWSVVSVDVPSYRLDVVNGMAADAPGGGWFKPNETPSLKANPPPEGMYFSGWTNILGTGQIGNTNHADTHFVMPAATAKVSAGYSNSPRYDLTVIDGVGGWLDMLAGTVRNVTATPPSGSSFTGWELVSGSGTFGNANSAATTFTIGAADTSIRATYASLSLSVNPVSNVAASGGSPSAGSTTVGWINPTGGAISITGPGLNIQNSTATSGSQVVNGLPPGDHTFTLTAAGGGTRTATFTVNSPPTIAWEQPASTAVTNATFNIRAKAQDVNGNIAGITVRRNGQPFATMDAATGNGFLRYSNPGFATETAAGTVTFTAFATDGNGVTSATITWQVQVIAADAPTIAWTKRPLSAEVDESFQIEATGEDSNGNLVRVDVWRNGVPFATVTHAGTTLLTSSPTQRTETQEGRVIFTAQATDAGGLQSPIIAHDVMVVLPGNTPPTIVWEEVPATSAPLNTSFSIKAKGEHANGKLTRVVVWRNDASVAEATHATGAAALSATATHSQSTPGVVTFSAQSFNKYGVGSNIITRHVSVGDASIPGESLTGVAASSVTVGTLGGEVSVDNRGSANYSIPLSGPAGRGGMQPQLALNYSSAAGNGTLGLGWSLSTGLPQSITRGRTILARDGQVRGVSFDANDKFYLDGKRLICVEGTYGSPGSKYRTEVDSFAVIETTGAGDNIEQFIVWEKSGQKFYFGKAFGTDDAYHMGGGAADGKAYAYALKRAEDPLGNYVELKYFNFGPGENHLSEIAYTGGPSATPRVNVTLAYNTRDVTGTTSKDRRDASTSFIGGRRFGLTRRLDDVWFTINGDSGAAAARYSLVYEYAPNFGPTRLTSVAAYLRDPADGTVTAVPPTSFVWSNTEPAFTSTGPTDVNATSTESGYFDEEMPEHYAFGDVNGDGKDDHVGFGWGGVGAVLSNGTDFGPAAIGSGSYFTYIGSPVNMWKLADVNGDGKKDVICGYVNPQTGQCRLWCMVSTGTRFIPLAGAEASGPTEIYSWSGDSTQSGDFTGLSLNGTAAEESEFAEYRGRVKGGVTNRIAIGDFNGDGRDDVLIHRFDGKLKVLTNQGASFTANTYDVGAQPVYVQKLWRGWMPHIELLGSNYVSVGLSMIPCDLNGDGLTDYAWSETTDEVGGQGDPLNFGNSQSQSYWAVTGQPGGGFSPKTSIAGNSWQLDKFIPNGGWMYRSSSYAVMPGDVNGDGLTDFTMLIPDATAPMPGGPAGYQEFVLRRVVRLSKGASGTPDFEFQEPNAASAVNVAGAQVLPWFDKMSRERFLEEFTMPALLSAFPDRQKVTSVLGTSAGDGVAMCDVNLDGREDYVWYVTDGSQPGWWVMYATANGDSPPQPAPLGWLAPRQLVQQGLGYNAVYRSARMALDLNGDGVKDYAYADHHISLAPGFVGFHLSTAPRGDRIETVVNGLGRTTTIDYKPITDDAIYTPGATDDPGTAAPAIEGVTYPIRELRNATYVVSDLYKDSGNATPAHFSYQYSGNRLDLSGRGGLGFHSFVTFDHKTKLFKYQFLAQSFPMTGLTHRDETYRYMDNGSFRFLSSHDNTVVFDEVVNGENTSQAWGTVYPFISKAIEYRWEDGATPHFTFPVAPATGQAEQLFQQNKPVDEAHIVISATSRFDLQDNVQTDLPGGYFASDYNAANPGPTRNVVAGVGNYAAFSALTFPQKITHGNLRELMTDFGGGYTETVATDYHPRLAGTNLTGLVKDVATSVASPGYGTESAPTKRFTYRPGLPLVETETIDASTDTLDLVTRHSYTASGLRNKTEISGTDLYQMGEGAVALHKMSSTETFDPRYDLPTTGQNAYNHSTTTAYDAYFGKPVSVTDVNNAQTTFAYDAMGRVTSTTDPLGLTTESVYGWTSPAATDWTEEQTVSPPTGSDGLEVSSTYAVRLAPVNQPAVTSYHDRLGRVIRTIKEGFNGAKTYTDTVYDVLGRPVATSLPYPETTTPNNILWSTTTYDALGRAEKVVAPNGTETRTQYQGRATIVTVDATDREPQTNTTVVDAKGRTVKVWNADNVPSFSDTKGTTSTVPSIEFTLDGFGRMRTTTLKGQAQTITATYDAHGRQTSLNDPDKGPWSYVNSSLGHVLRQQDAKGNVTTTRYDPLGRTLKRTTVEVSTGAVPVETAFWFYYDAAADEDKQLVAKGTNGWIGALAREESMTANKPGLADPGTTTTRYYDSFGRPWMDMRGVAGTWFYTVTDYDPVKKKLPRQVQHYWRPVGAEQASEAPYVWKSFGYAYTYDAKSYVLKVEDTTNSARTWWAADATQGYDHLDRPVRVQKGPYWTLRTYRPQDGLLASILTSQTAGGGDVQHLTFGYDGLGNLTSRRDVLHSTGGQNLDEAFSYDALNRLTHRNGGETTRYHANGNIDWKKDVTNAQSAPYGYTSSRPHAVTTAWGYVMSYDANGNLLTRSKADDTWQLAWTGFDKPRWMAKTTPAGTAGSEFLYDANRSRVMHLEFDQLTNNVPSRYTRKRVYGLGATLEVDYTLQTVDNVSTWKNEMTRIYVPTPDGTAGSIEFIPLGEGSGLTEKPVIHHHDHLGSVESISPFTPPVYAYDLANRLSRYSYDAWGQRRDPIDWSGSPDTTARGGHDGLTHRGFTGHEMLDDLGLAHMNGRVYDGLLGRFLSADIYVQAPGSLQSFNRYSYVFNNPLTLVDPSGFTGWAAFPGRTVTGELVSESGRGRTAATLKEGVERLTESYHSGKAHFEAGFTEFANVPSSSTPVLDVTIATLHIVAGTGDAVGIVADHAPGAKQVKATANVVKNADEIAEGASKLTKALADKLDNVGASKVKGQLDDAAIDTKKVEIDTQKPATHPLDPEAKPYADVTGKTYEKGSPDKVVTDHIDSRAAGGHPTDPANLDPKSWEANSRKAGFEGNLAKDRQAMIDAGMDPADVDKALAPEKKWIMNDVHAVPVDPEKLKKLQQQ